MLSVSFFYLTNPNSTYKGGEESCFACIWPADDRNKNLFDTVEFIRPTHNLTDNKFQPAPSLPRPMCCGDVIVFGEPDDQTIYLTGGLAIVNGEFTALDTILTYRHADLGSVINYKILNLM